MATRMVKKGHDVTVLCGSFGAGKTGLTGPFVKGKRQGMVDGIRVIELELPYHNKDSFLKRVFTFLKFALRTIKAISTIQKPDLVYATSTPLTIAIPALWGKWVRGVPYIFEVRDLWPELPVAMGVIKNPLVIKGLGLLEKTAYKQASACVGLSPGMIRGIESVTGEDKKIHLIPNGCDIELFRSATDCYVAKYGDSKLFEEVPWIDPTKCNLVFAGTLGMANGLEALISAVSMLDKNVRDKIHVHLIGDGNEKQKLQTMVSENQLSKNIFFHDPLPKSELVEVMGLFDAGILTLRDVPEFQYGTSPNKFFDYIASGLPVLNNYQGWVAEMITEHGCGYYSKASDHTDFASILERFSTSSSEEKVAMSKRAAKLAKQFDRKVLAQEQIALCEAVCRA